MYIYLTFSATFDSFILLPSTPQLLPAVATEGCNHLRLKTSSLEYTFPFVLMHSLCRVRCLWPQHTTRILASNLTKMQLKLNCISLWAVPYDGTKI